MPIVPFAATATDGTNACRLAAGMFSGVRFTRIGADQEKPPSADIEKAMSLYWKLEKRPSSQTAYRLPFRISTENEGLVGSCMNCPVSRSMTRVSPSGRYSGVIAMASTGEDQIWP